MPDEVTIAKLRAWWAHRQGLDGSLAGASPHEVLTRTGWARSVGGAGPYLGFFARAGLSRKAVDDAVAAMEVHELPAARGCTYVLPAADFALGLTVGAGPPADDASTAKKHLGVTQAEIDALCDAVLERLTEAAAPLGPDELKKALGDAVRNLGDEGRRRGVSTTLPLALGLLQARGRIHRVPVDGRLDQQRFGYVPWSPSPLAGGAPDFDAAAVDLARRYFSWAAPASLKHFRWFSGFGAAVAKKAIAALDLCPVAGTDLLIPADQEADFHAYAVPDEPCYALVAWLDGIHLLHRDLGRLLDPGDADRQVPGGKPGTTLGSLADPRSPIVVDRGRVVGLWEYDPEAADIVCQSFVGYDDALRAAISRTAAFAGEQLGDVRVNSLDSPRSRAPRIEALRAAAD